MQNPVVSHLFKGGGGGGREVYRLYRGCCFIVFDRYTPIYIFARARFCRLKCLTSGATLSLEIFTDLDKDVNWSKIMYLSFLLFFFF